MYQTLGLICFVYLFGEKNGVLFKIPRCKKWGIPLPKLEKRLRRMGYGFADVSIAMWSDKAPEPFYSKPYKLDSLIELSM